MKCTIPEISWHNRDPVLTVDIQSCSQSNDIYRLATGGTDHHVVIWQLNILENGGVSVEMLSDLVRHNRAVNAVRFSPSGQILASSDDEAAIILWKKNEDNNDIFIEESEKENKEHWSVLKMLRGHIEDVYDLSWSKCSQFLISGSVDNSAILWDVQKGKSISILNDHKGFVQGVAWDPKGQLVATLSSDRYMRVYNLSTKKAIHRVYKAPLPQLTSSDESPKSTRLFYDDTLKSFCRRLSFSPDGQLLVAPSGILEDPEGKQVNVTHVFIRSCLSRPVLCLPTHDRYTIAVRFCPRLFELRPIKTEDEDGKPAFTELFALPYRMVFAVVTQNAVLLYDTQQPIPFAKVSNIHYTRLSDVSWSSDGRIMIVSSTDGYCSLVSFGDDELGTPFTSPDPQSTSDPEMETSEAHNDKQLSPTVEKRSLSDEPLVADRNGPPPASPTREKQPVTREATSESTGPPKSVRVNPIPVKRKTGKRIELITLSTATQGPGKNAQTSPVTKSTEVLTPVEPTVVSERTPTKEPEADSPTKGPRKDATPSGTPGSKFPRRVPLITLSSPKSKT